MDGSEGGMMGGLSAKKAEAGLNLMFVPFVPNPEYADRRTDDLSNLERRQRVGGHFEKVSNNSSSE